MTGLSGSLNLRMPRYTPPVGDSQRAAIQRDYLEFLAGVAGHCGDIGTYLRDGQPAVLVNSPELARALLIDQAGKVTKGELQHTAFRDLLGESISLSEDERHRMLRRLLAPLFTRRQMTRYADRIVGTAAAFCATWPHAGTMDLFDELHRLTLHTLGRTLIAEPQLWDEHGPFWCDRELLWKWISGHAGRGHGLASKAATGQASAFTAAIARVQATVDQVIARRLRDAASPPADLLGDILAANQSAGFPLSVPEVRDQVLALLFAAHETSACALFWSLFLLSRHPYLQQTLECELDAVLGGRVPTAHDAAVLPRTAQVLKEAMRLYPPAGRQFRVTAKPSTLGTHPIPAGTPVTVCQYLLHRREDSFPDASRFDPQRFATAAPPRHPMAYVPFGAGDRICLGRHYALLETQLLLALLAARFRFVFPDPVPPQLAVTLRPRGHVQVQVHRRGMG
jgi:cytochrome P450